MSYGGVSICDCGHTWGGHKNQEPNQCMYCQCPEFHLFNEKEGEGKKDMRKCMNKSCEHSTYAHRGGGKCMWFGCPCGKLDEGEGGKERASKSTNIVSTTTQKSLYGSDGTVWCTCGHDEQEHEVVQEKGSTEWKDGGCTVPGCACSLLTYDLKTHKGTTFKCSCKHRREKHALKGGKDAECLVKGCSCTLYDGPVPASWGGSTYTYVHCDHKPFEVLKGDGWSVWGGTKGTCMGEMTQFDVLLNCSQSSVFRSHDVPYEWFSKYSGHGPKNTKEINFDWPDQSIPYLPAAFWLELKREFERSKSRVLAFCVGGHGRTGTALACLMIACGYSAQEAVEWIRTNYCKEAIESKTQEEYVVKMGEDMRELLEGESASTTKKGVIA